MRQTTNNERTNRQQTTNNYPIIEPLQIFLLDLLDFFEIWRSTILAPQLLWFGIDSTLNIFQQTITELMNELMNEGGDCRTALATPGLLNIKTTKHFLEFILWKYCWQCSYFDLVNWPFDKIVDIFTSHVKKFTCEFNILTYNINILRMSIFWLTTFRLLTFWRTPSFCGHLTVQEIYKKLDIGWRCWLRIYIDIFVLIILYYLNDFYFNL